MDTESKPVLHSSIKAYMDATQKKQNSQKLDLKFQGNDAVKLLSARVDTLESQLGKLLALITQSAEKMPVQSPSEKQRVEKE